MEYITNNIEEIVKYLGVYGLSMVKFIGGPLLGVGSGLGMVETMLLTILGMMTSVMLFTTLLGDRFKQMFREYFAPNRKRFSNKSRRIVKIWQNFGIKGVAFLTPILFTPILGTIIANSFGEEKRKIFLYMTVSAVFWSVIITVLVFLVKSEAVQSL